jgi:DNA adenine methylase
MRTILKWPGGKEKELPVIREHIPAYLGRYVEPFVGGGAVFFDVNTPNCCINDRSHELINLYRCVQTQDQDFIHSLQSEADAFRLLEQFTDTHTEALLQLYHSETPRDAVSNFVGHYFDTVFQPLAGSYNEIFCNELKKNLTNKITRSQHLEQANGALPDDDRLNNMEAALKSAYYMLIRFLLNHPAGLSMGQQAAVFFFIREYCYSSMFRYNASGEFNVPYGGISYNRKDFQRKIDYMLSGDVQQKLTNSMIENNDFEVFMEGLHLTRNDFVFLDPPYDSDFSTYAQNIFGREEQIRLCEHLRRTPAKILLVIKNTDFIRELYQNDFRITSFSKRYLVSFMNRNERDATHLIITNY